MHGVNIAALVSGGVDSSVAVHRLKKQGHTVTAFYLKIWLEDELSSLGKCPWEEDLEMVHAVCDPFQIPVQILPLQREYSERVIHYTLEEVRAGRTPNPDILCNQQIKFGVVYDKIGETYEKIATGHYAQVEEVDGVFYLKKSPDSVKDQTYFLSRLSQAQLARACFPIGEWTKAEVRSKAKAWDLPNADRKDSQGLCFLGKIRFREFLRYHLGEKEGDLREWETGGKVGTHPGFWYYTVGQREGLGLSGGPWYVVKKDPNENCVYISRAYHDPSKRRDQIEVEQLHWLSGQSPPRGQVLMLDVKVRHSATVYPAQVCLADDGEHATVTLAESDQGLAPGQFTVFYDGQLCLGSGINLSQG